MRVSNRTKLRLALYVPLAVAFLAFLLWPMITARVALVVIVVAAVFFKWLERDILRGGQGCETLTGWEDRDG